MLVLLHGAGMDADQWYRTGQIQNYMDNLIADRSIVPFVVVMPSSERVYYIGKSDLHITQELPAWLKSRYGQTLEARRTAAAGMSMGGFGAVILPLNHSTMFGLVMYTGDHDRVTESAPLFLDKLKQTGARYSYHEDAGAHTWNYWSHHNAEMLRVMSRYFVTGKLP